MNCFHFVSSTCLLVASTAADPFFTAETCFNDDATGCLDAEFEMVVVGAGTAGSVVAARLAEYGFKTLLLDVGMDQCDSSMIYDADNFVGAALQNTFAEQLYTLEGPHAKFSPESGLPVGPNSKNAFINVPPTYEGRSMWFPLSKSFGGASAINFGGWYRAPKSDYDEWARIVEDDSWSYDSMLPFLKRTERYDGDEGLEYRGYDGVIPVHYAPVSAAHLNLGSLASIDKHFGERVEEVQDYNGALQSGVATLQTTREEDGCLGEVGCAEQLRRGNAYAEYINRAAENGVDLGDNLVVRPHARVVKVGNLKEGDAGPVEVEYIDEETGERFVVRATKEVVLSAGTWGSPKIALLSGVGPKEELADVGVASVVDSPSVGKHLLDHATLWTEIELSGNFSEIEASAKAPYDMPTLANSNVTLPEQMDRLNVILFFFKSSEEAADSKDFELMMGFRRTGESTGTSRIVLYQYKNSAGPDTDLASGGSIRLSSSDPLDMAVASRGFSALLDDEVITPFLHAFKKTAAMVSDLSCDAAFTLPNEAEVDLDDDESIKRFIREAIWSESHLMGTMRMGSDDAAVVDSELRLKGSNSRVRVADTSIFPTGTRAHSMGPAMAVGEKAADLIFKTWTTTNAPTAAVVSAASSLLYAPRSPASAVAALVAAICACGVALEGVSHP